MNGDKLREKRLAMKLTQEKLAEILSVRTNTVARWERGILAVPTTVALAMEAVEIKFKKKRKKAA
jgi:transcriptional regulator with XRE-family HTH domain